MVERSTVPGGTQTSGERTAIDRGEKESYDIVFEPAKSVEESLTNAQPPVKKAKEERPRSGDLFDFETELLDIARSVSEGDTGFLKNVSTSEDRLFDEEYENSDTAALSTLNYSFNVEAIPKADTNEDSARETMNLVEKLRMQYAIKTCPTPAAGLSNVVENSINSDQLTSPKSEDNQKSYDAAPAMVDKTPESSFADQSLTSSSNSIVTSKWKPLTPAKESTTNTSDVESPVPVLEKPVLEATNKPSEPTKLQTPLPEQIESSPTLSPYSHTNPSSSGQEHTLSPYFFNVPYPNPFPFPPYFSSFYRPEFLPPFLFPSSYNSAGMGDVPLLPRPSVPSQAQPFMCPPHSTSSLPTGLPLPSPEMRKESSLLSETPDTKVVNEPDELQIQTDVQDISKSSAQINQSDKVLMEPLMARSPVHSFVGSSSSEIQLTGEAVSQLTETSGPTTKEKSPPILVAKTSKPSIDREPCQQVYLEETGLSSFASTSIETPYRTGQPTISAEIPSVVSSPATEAATTSGSERRQRPTRQAAINATKAAAEQLNEMHPIVPAPSSEPVMIAEQPLPVHSNLSPNRPRGGSRGRGGQRGARGKGGAGTKRVSMGVFEPKLVSGLSSQDLAGTVYDFDDFNDDVSDAERNSTLGTKLIRKSETFSSPLSGKSPKCKPGSQSLSSSGLTRLRKSREPSSDSASFDSENEISRRTSNPSSISATYQPDKLSPIRKRSVECEAAPPPPQVVPPMRLTIPRVNSNLNQLDANVSINNSQLGTNQLSYNRLVEEAPSMTELKRESVAPLVSTERDGEDLPGDQSLMNENKILVSSKSSSSPATGVGQSSNLPVEPFSRTPSISGPSVKAMQDLEALNRAIESALAVKPSTAETSRQEQNVPLTSFVATTVSTTVPINSSSNNIMTSIDTSRHALKFKIKGPFLDANYSGNTVNATSNLTSALNASNPTSTPTAESSNLRRMRKKELIRQYVSQDVTTPAQPSHLNAFLHLPYSSALAYANKEYLLAGSNDLSEVIGSTNVGTLPCSTALGQQTSGSFTGNKSHHISIPKAVASLGSALGSFGGHDDYITTNQTIEVRDGKRRRRGNSTNPPLSRELRNLQMSASVIEPPTGADKVLEAEVGRRKERRRGRPPNNRTCLDMAHVSEKDTNGPQEFVTHPPPKLKIRFREKLGAGEVVTVCDPAIEASLDNQSGELLGTRAKEEDTEAKKIRFRPPKKRISDSGCDLGKPIGGSHETPRLENNPPTLEELWRQSMKFREEVMADFSKSERRKGQPVQSTDDNTNSTKSDAPPCGLDSKPEFKNKRHKTKTRKDRSKSKDRDGNNRRRPPIASTDLVSIAGGGLDGNELVAGSGGIVIGFSGDIGENSRKRKRSLSGECDVNSSIDVHTARNGVQIISKDSRENFNGPPKLIIRFGKKPVSGVGGNRDPQIDLKSQSEGEHMESQGSEDVTPPPPLEKPEGDDVPTVTSVRLMPIKLKLARCSQGSYVTKAKSDSTPPPSPTATPKESCEVR